VVVDATQLRGRIARIARSAVHDGPGVRTVVFFKGCPLRCTWCHSPETQGIDAEVLLLQDRCICCGACLGACEHAAARLQGDGPAIDRARCARCGDCAAVCPSGARELHGALLDVGAVMAAIRRDVPFYDGSGGGVTFSGGEPLLQPTFLVALLERCRAEGVRAAVETCGHAPREAALRVLEHSPLFLYDVKLVDNDRHRVATGASNTPIIANLRELAGRHADVVIRFPLVPGVTDDEENVRGVAALAASVGVTRIDVLPYHRAGAAKYWRLGRTYALDAVPATAAEEAASAAALMREFGLDARVGGSS
jgi:pyruvate formate lyase activating enzyme